MGTENVDIRVSAAVRGQAAVKQLNNELRSMGESVKGAQRNWAATTAVFAAGGAAFYAAARAVGAVWDALKEGTAMQFAQTRFENLATSFGTSSAAMMNSLRTATSGMYSDMQLVDSASQIMAVGLAKDAEGVVRMATAVGKLGIDMNQLVLELNTMRGMRLDQMGLDIVVVQAKAAALELTGLSERAAYTEAVLQTMEEKIANQGDIAETSAGKVARAGATMANSWNDVKIGLAELADNSGFLDWMDSVSQVSAANRELETTLDGLVAAGEISEAQALRLQRAWGFSAETHALAADTIARLTAETQTSATSTGMLADATARAAQEAASADGVMLSLGTRMVALANYSGTAAQQMLRWGQAVADAVNLATAKQAAMGTGNWYGQRAKALSDEQAALYGVSKALNTATAAYGGYSSAIDKAAERQRAFVSAFTEELSTGFDEANDAMKERQELISQGLINDEGVANITAINHAMYEQAQALGMSAGQLALYGVALGEFTEEQARAALKAAVIQQRIIDLSKAVAAGQLSFGDAVAGAQDFAVELDTASAQTSVEDLAAAVDAYASNGPYDASVDAHTSSALNNLNAVIDLLNDIDGRVVRARAEVTTSTDGTSTSSSDETDNDGIPGNGRARGGPVAKGGTYWVGEHGPEQVTFDQPGYVHPYGRSPREGINVVVNNYISGSSGDASATATMTVDTVKGAMRRLGVG